MLAPKFMLNVGFLNVSTVVTAAQLTQCVAALQLQAGQDFGSIYGIDVNLPVITDPAVLGPKDWLVVVSDDADQAGALGYHQLTAQGQPLGKVFARTSQQAGDNWTVTASHELLEMLADPWASLICQGADNVLRAFEVCDPVEDDSLGYQLDGGFGPVTVSDFVLPAWFNSAPGPFDFKGHVTAPLQILPNGYIGELINGVWTQVTGKNGRSAHRAELRALPKTEWRRSL